jgi:membrane-anchored protein YejM (alkaline phosphatase superfamily)
MELLASEYEVSISFNHFMMFMSILSIFAVIQLNAWKWQKLSSPNQKDVSESVTMLLPSSE